jgi:hypothetical protein
MMEIDLIYTHVQQLQQQERIPARIRRLLGELHKVKKT